MYLSLPHTQNPQSTALSMRITWALLYLSLLITEEFGEDKMRVIFPQWKTLVRNQSKLGCGNIFLLLNYRSFSNQTVLFNCQKYPRTNIAKSTECLVEMRCKLIPVDCKLFNINIYSFTCLCNFSVKVHTCNPCGQGYTKPACLGSQNTRNWSLRRPWFTGNARFLLIPQWIFWYQRTLF